MSLVKEGVPLKQIAKRTGHSRGLVRMVVRGERTDIFRTRESSLEAHLLWLDAQWDAGSRNATELWRRINQRGFRGSRRVVSEWATRRRRAEQASDSNLRRVPSARTIARLMTSRRDRLSKAETVIVAAVEDGVPALIEARTLVAEFHAMIRGQRHLQPRAMAPARPIEPYRILRPWSAQRRSCGPRRDQLIMVQRPDRGSNHQTQARQTPDVRARKARSPASQADRCIVMVLCTEIASEPKLHADSHPADLCIRSLVVKRFGQILDGLSLPLRDLARVKLMLRRQFRNRPLTADRLKCNLGFELGREPSACLHTGSTFSSVDPPYAPVSEPTPPQFLFACTEQIAARLDLRAKYLADR